MHNVTFEEKQGYRGGTVEGRWYPSVSACLDVLHPPDMTWIDQADLDRGTRLHQAALNYVKKIKTDVRPEDLTRLLPLYRWIDTHLKLTLFAEKTLFSPTYRYVGTPDWVGLAKTGAHWTIDWKFAETIEKRYYDQAEAYTHFSETSGTRTHIVQIDKTGAIRVIPVKRREAAWAAFQAARNVIAYRMSLRSS